MPNPFAAPHPQSAKDVVVACCGWGFSPLKRTDKKNRMGAESHPVYGHLVATTTQGADQLPKHTLSSVHAFSQNVYSMCALGISVCFPTHARVNSCIPLLMISHR